MAQPHDDKVTVELIGYQDGLETQARNYLAKNFKLEPARAAALLQRLPKVITKPLDPTQAQTIIRRLESAGLQARVLTPQTPSPSVARPAPAPEPTDTWQPLAEDEAVTRPHAPLQTTEEAAVTWRDDMPSNGAPSFAGPPTGAPATQVAVQTSAATEEAEPRARDNRGKGKRNRGKRNLFGASAAKDDSPQDIQAPPASETQAIAAESMANEKANDSSNDPSMNAPALNARKRRRGSVLNKILSAIILPSLISIIGVVLGILFLVSPALREQLLAAARQPAEATVRNLAPALRESSNSRFGDRADLQDADRLTAVQRALAEARAFVSGQNIEFMVVTDPKGTFVSGWFNTPETPLGTGFSNTLNALAPQLQQNQELETTFSNSQGKELDVIARSLNGPEGSLGGLFVGIDTASRQRQVQRLLLFASALLLPLLLGLALGILLGRNVTRNVRSLAIAADDLSRGNLNANIDVRSNDEIGELADAFERLRTSLRLAFERMRRKR